MQDLSLGVIEARFADIIWQNAPISSTELVRLAQEALGWKKSTTYTVLKRLCEKGIFENSNATVTPKLSREEFHSLQSQKFVADTFQGSLPAFLTAFTSGKRLTQEEVRQLRQLIAEHEEGV